MQIVPASPPEAAAHRDQQLRTAAQDLETTFLAEMLKSAGLGETRGAFGGGAGEDQFASFLLREQAAAMVRAGGIGLSETIFESLKERNDATPID
jgi:flagellar protein FlgJ